MLLTVAKNRLPQTVALSHSVQHCTRLNCAPFSINFAHVTSVRFVTYTEFDFTRLKQVSQLWQRPCKLGNFKGVGHFEAKFSVEGLRFAPICLAIAYQLELGTTEQHDNITVAM